MSARHVLVCVCLFAAGVAFGLVGRRPAGPAAGTLAVGSEIVVTYPTGERLPKHGGGTVAAVRREALHVYRTSGGPVADPPVDKDVTLIEVNGVTYFCVP